MQKLAIASDCHKILMKKEKIIDIQILFDTIPLRRQGLKFFDCAASSKFLSMKRSLEIMGILKPLLWSIAFVHLDTPDYPVK